MSCWQHACFLRIKFGHRKFKCPGGLATRTHSTPLGTRHSAVAWRTNSVELPTQQMGQDRAVAAAPGRRDIARASRSQFRFTRQPARQRWRIEVHHPACRNLRSNTTLRPTDRSRPLLQKSTTTTLGDVRTPSSAIKGSPGTTSCNARPTRSDQPRQARCRRRRRTCKDKIAPTHQNHNSTPEHIEKAKENPKTFKLQMPNQKRILAPSLHGFDYCMAFVGWSPQCPQSSAPRNWLWCSWKSRQSKIKRSSTGNCNASCTAAATMPKSGAV